MVVIYIGEGSKLGPFEFLALPLGVSISNEISNLEWPNCETFSYTKLTSCADMLK